MIFQNLLYLDPAVMHAVRVEWAEVKDIRRAKGGWQVGPLAGDSSEKTLKSKDPGERITESTSVKGDKV